MRLQEPLGRSLKFTPLTKMGKQEHSCHIAKIASTTQFWMKTACVESKDVREGEEEKVCF